MNQKQVYESASAGIILIGLGILFLTGVGIWPWILLVVGLAGLPAALANHRGWYGWQGFFWLAGLAILFATGTMWPGILILVGLSTLFGVLVKPEGRVGQAVPEAPAMERGPEYESPFGEPPASEPPREEGRDTKRLG
jgi:xanthine/uracil/vitamin C permease (AzgA family)